MDRARLKCPRKDRRIAGPLAKRPAQKSKIGATLDLFLTVSIDAACVHSDNSDVHPGGNGQIVASMTPLLPRGGLQFVGVWLSSGSRIGQLGPQSYPCPRTLYRQNIFGNTSRSFFNPASVLSTTYHTRAVFGLLRNDIRRQLVSKMTSSTTARQHSGHSHHHHHHDNTYLTSTNKKDAGVRITRIGLYVNFLMAFGKGIGGYFLNSQSLIADAFHSLTDLVSDFLTLATVAWSLKSPTARFPGGYGKIESLGSLGVSSLLLAGGLGLGWHSAEILYSQLFLDVAAAAAEHGHGHDHSHGGGIFSHSHSHNPADMGIPNVHAAWIAGGSIIVKEYLYRAST